LTKAIDVHLMVVEPEHYISRSRRQARRCSHFIEATIHVSAS
jgi:pentose-5-phosphate-3-epimerase